MTDSQDARPSQDGSARGMSVHARVALLGVALTLIGVAMVSSGALLAVLSDGAWATLIVVGGVGYGLWLVRGLGLGWTSPSVQIVFAAGLGLGVLSLVMLGLGTAGVLERGVWLGIVLAGVIAGVAYAPRLMNARAQDANVIRFPDDSAPDWPAWLWLVVVPFAVFALLGGTMPPGILWPAEGRGYDVLEYHLGVPRVYYDAGHITYLPDNIYSNFPFNVEMLYLLSMVLRGGPIAGVLTAKLVNVWLAGLAVAAVWLAARPYGRVAGGAAGLLAATCPFVAYLCGVAYVENGLVFYAALALAAAMRGWGDEAKGGRWLLNAGLFAGLACGCKYTGVVATLVPLGLAADWQAARGRGGWRGVALFAAGAVVTFAPWLVKNAVYTHNPIFPLAHDVMPERTGVWDDDGAARWKEGHKPAPEHRTVMGRLERVAGEVLLSAKFGGLVLLGLMAGVVILAWRMARNGMPPGGVVGPGSMIVVGLIAWAGFTHLVDRFAIVLIVPAAALAGAAVDAVSQRWHRVPVIGFVLLWAAWQGSVVTRFWTRPLVPGASETYVSSAFFGQTQAVQSAASHVAAVNDIVRNGGRVLLVAEARRLYYEPGVDYCVVFNRNPLAEAAQSKSPGGLLDWLREQGYTHIYVDWAEMRRLRNSRYGFWEGVDAALFAQLVEVGLHVQERFPIGSEAYRTLYALPAR